MLDRAQVDENVAAGEMPPLSAADRDAIRHIYENHLFYDPAAKVVVPPASPS